MRLDHSKAIARISFTGLFVFCLNEQRQCEVGIFKHEEHTPQLSIQEIGLENIPRKIEHNFNLDNDLMIKAIYSVKPGVAKNLQPDFDRQSDTGDPEDFRWLTDLEGEEFHQRKLSIEPQPENPALRSILYINDGDLYTCLKSYDVYARVPVQNAPPEIFLGKTAHVVAADITCEDNPDSGILLKDKVTGYELFLPWYRNQASDQFSRYEIAFNNTRAQPMSIGQISDFVLYYQLVKDPDDVMFDLRKTVEEGDRRSTGQRIRGSFRLLDGRPIICDGIYLGQTTSLSASR